MTVIRSCLLSTPARHGALSGKAEAAATPVKGQALCFAPLDRRSTSGFGFSAHIGPDLPTKG